MKRAFSTNAQRTLLRHASLERTIVVTAVSLWWNDNKEVFRQGTALLTLVAMVLPTLIPKRALADEPVFVPADDVSYQDNSFRVQATTPSISDSASATPHASGVNPQAVDTPNVKAIPNFIDIAHSLPSGADKSGVSSQSISSPQGSGKIQGMGESFSAQLSTGIGTFSVPFSLLPARGGAQPSLGLSYSSSSGHGLAGVGWDVGVPSISRQTDRGIPRYKDPQVGGAWHPEQDTFVFNGGQELVPICLISNGACEGALAEERMPDWSNQWQYFRPRVEGSFLRFFWSPDHKTWIVQDKSGSVMELGKPVVANPNLPLSGELEVNPQNGSQIFRWNLARQYDAQPNAVNHVVYRYKVVDSTSYLSDIFDTSPVSSPSSPSLSGYAHHTRLVWEERPDPTFSYRRGWKTSSTLRLSGVDVTSKSFESAGSRKMVRRYHLSYDGAYHASLLSKVQLEGRCYSTGPDENVEELAEDSSFALGDSGCPVLPPLTFEYEHVEPFHADGSVATADLPGYEGFDERLLSLSNSPDHSIDEELTDLFDINSDGLPDVLVTAPSLYNGDHGVFFNSLDGTAGKFKQCTMGVQGVLGADSNVIKLSNDNLVAQDLDGDAIIDLLHMPKVKTYSVYSPVIVPSASPGGCPTANWKGRTINTADQQNVKIDFGSDAAETHVMDVNADGLVDVVVSTGTEMQTFFALGRYPNADGQFGYAKRTSKTAAQVYNEPVTSCVPHAGLPVKFSDPEIKLGDMNGDGLVDIVKVQNHAIQYWPGRGNGYWGIGDPTACPGGGFGQSIHIAMDNSPQIATLDSPSLRLDDVNGDGLDDLVQIRFDAVDIWLNVDGIGWTERHSIDNTPASPNYANRVRLVDMNGSGTRDILFGHGFEFQYIDLLGGRRPWVLTHVDNGLGKTTDIEYTTSTELMLQAQKAGTPWTSKAPSPLHVVRRVTEHDNLAVVGRPAGDYTTEYTYANPVYDGPQREFRGFRNVEAKRLGDSNSPTSSSSSIFLLGECAGEGKGACPAADRWKDNPNEALKGLPAVAETFDTKGVYLSTSHHTYGLRRLYEGLDGRGVWYAYEKASDSFAYDTASSASFQNYSGPIALPEIEREYDNLGATQRTLPLRAADGRVQIHGSVEVDVFGNKTKTIASGCVSGCAVPDEIITAHSEPKLLPHPSGWLWRTEYSYATGNAGPSVQRKKTKTDFDASGNPTDSWAELWGTEPLDRFHAQPKDTAPDPTQHGAAAEWIHLSYSEYNAFGQSRFARGAGYRCRGIEYDSQFSILPTQESVFVGAAGDNGCGSTELKTSASYDMGLGLILRTTDLHDEKTEVKYDGFGRLSESWAPDPIAVGAVSPKPAVQVEYLLTADPQSQPYSLMHTRTLDGEHLGDNEYMEAWAYVDGMGRTMVTLGEADLQVDGHQWVVNGLTQYDQKGAAERGYLAWYWDGNPMQFPLTYAPTTPYSRQRYDAFGRQVQTFGLDGTESLRSSYHALSTDLRDANDLTPGPHFNTYVTTKKDGHGRGTVTVERVKDASGALELREVRTSYLFSGEVESIRRVRVGHSDPDVVRWMRYDSLGRMILNVEPHTTKNFSEDVNVLASSIEMKAWRYAYDDAGELIGTSDARGCGVNFYYDAGGRLIGEDYSPCESHHQPYSQPELDDYRTAVLNGGENMEVYYRYDFKDPDTDTIVYQDPAQNAPQPFEVDDSLLLGRLVSVSDLASKVVTRYDGRGRVTGVAKRVAKPTVTSFADRYAERWYVQTAEFDAANRPLKQSTGVQAAELTGAGEQSYVRTHYTRRGTVSNVDGAYGTLVHHVYRDADGLVTQIQYGDTAGTTTDFTYDQRRRVKTVQTHRQPPASWTNVPADYLPSPTYAADPTTSFQLMLQDDELSYDVVDNPVEIRDWRNAAEWPVSAKPVSRTMRYDDLNRVVGIDYHYPTADGKDAWKSPFEADFDPAMQDNRRAKPSPHVSFDSRPLSQTFQYDWLGNQTVTDDDSHGFYDRSLGTVTNNTPNGKPYQLTAAQQTTGTNTGSLETEYDVAGNLVDMAVIRDGDCLPTGAVCSQRFVYDWDEVGRLMRARRWDMASPSVQDSIPTTTPAADLRHSYDASDNRVIKTAVDENEESSYTVYIFGALELRRTSFDTTATPDDYTDDIDTEVGYLFGHGVRLARLHWEDSGSPVIGGANLHVLFELGDHLGSSSKVLDKATSELVEASTYMGYGQAESDYRPGRWKSFREDYRFTGKEEDSEVGLIYFGKRFLSSQLGRWASADPLIIHVVRGDQNAYAYVHGRLLRVTDPMGLDDKSDARETEAAWTLSKETPDRNGAKGDRIVADFTEGTYSQYGKFGDEGARAYHRGPRVRMWAKNASDGYDNVEAAVAAASAQYFMYSRVNEREFSTYIYSRMVDGQKRYFYGDALVGLANDHAGNGMAIYAFDSQSGSPGQYEAKWHSHPVYEGPNAGSREFSGPKHPLMRGNLGSPASWGGDEASFQSHAQSLEKEMAKNGTSFTVDKMPRNFMTDAEGNIREMRLVGDSKGYPQRDYAQIWSASFTLQVDPNSKVHAETKSWAVQSYSVSTGIVGTMAPSYLNLLSTLNTVRWEQVQGRR